MLIRLLLLISFFISFASATLVIQEDDIKIDNFSLQYYYDENRSLKIEDIANKTFKKSIKNQFALGYINGNSWFKFTIQNNTKNDTLLLYFTETFLENVELYEYKNNTWIQNSVNLKTPLVQRLLNDINPVFELHIQANETKNFYIKIYAKFTQYGSFEIHKNQKTIINYQLYSMALYLFYFGGLFIMVCFNLFLFFTVKDRIYIYYVGYVFFSMVFVLTFSGLNLYLGLANWHHELYYVIPPLVISLILFTVNFLKTKKNLPHTYKLLQLLILLFIALEILAFIDFKTWLPKMSLLSLITYMVLLYTAIKSYLKKIIIAKYYLFAMSIYIITIIMMSSMVNGLVENNNINRYSFVLASFFEILIFALMLANRFNESQKEKIKVQHQLIMIQNTNEQFLQQEVESRTDKIKSLLKDKELLLQEVHHRVKNNFHSILSMLWLESKKENNTLCKTSFKEIISRIRSLASIHQLIFESEEFSQVETKIYLTKIIDETKKAYDTQFLSIDTKIDKCALSMQDAMSLGIITNEIITNSIKHHGDGKCIIELSFINKNNKIYLAIKDNGSCFKEDTNPKGYGLNMVKQISKKLKNSELHFSCEGGNKFELNFEIS